MVVVLSFLLGLAAKNGSCEISAPSSEENASRSLSQEWGRVRMVAYSACLSSVDRVSACRSLLVG